MAWKSGIIILWVVTVNSLCAQQTNRISVAMTSQSYINGKKYVQEATCYYSNETGIFVSQYKNPNEFVKITNRNGEMKIYFPESNQVSIKQDFYFSSENELLHYFVNNLTDDLGLIKEGFVLSETRYDEDFFITSWLAPSELLSVKNIEIVYEDMLPIFSKYIDNEEKTIKKIYYSNYYDGTDFMLPLNITEISFTPENDSTIRRTLYSDVRVNEDVNSNFLNFTIPQDATIIK
ncbi:MAG: hypothetical protein K8R68_12330 [Bacteroidales bacterium]|nr:hypothetical protein [Bacteroidales bacterium]